MIECREIVDSVKADIEKEDTVKMSEVIPNNVSGVNIVYDKDGNICQDCTDLQAEFAKNPGGLPPKRAGLIIASIVGGVGIAITTICVPFVLPALRRVCLPFVPATNTQLANVRYDRRQEITFIIILFSFPRSALRGRETVKSKPTLLDIGSGDGRIVIQSAQQGFKATGVELNRWLVYYSRCVD